MWVEVHWVQLALDRTRWCRDVVDTAIRCWGLSRGREFLDQPNEYELVEYPVPWS
jgi:hypothetical protein